MTKAGTNNLHGNVWEYLRNDALDANPFFANHFADPAQRKKTPLHLNQFGGTVGGPILKNKLFFFAAYQGDRFIISNPGQVLAESSEFRQSVIATFPDSISSLLYSNFAPSNSGSQAYTLREYVGDGFSGFGFSNFGDYLCPNSSTGITSAMSSQFAALFGVEQADIEYMNQQANCPSGSPYSTPVVGAFGRDLPFLVNVLNVGKSQVSDNLFNGNEASIRLDYNFSAKDRLFGQFNWSKASDQFALGGMAIPALPVLNRKRGNPNWGRPIPRAPALATEFELQVTQLQLTAEMYTSSRELRIWCDRNRNRVYIPEWLLEKWDITVDAIFGGAPRDR